MDKKDSRRAVEIFLIAPAANYFHLLLFPSHPLVIPMAASDVSLTDEIN